MILVRRFFSIYSSLYSSFSVNSYPLYHFLSFLLLFFFFFLFYRLFPLFPFFSSFLYFLKISIYLPHFFFLHLCRHLYEQSAVKYKDIWNPFQNTSVIKINVVSPCPHHTCVRTLADILVYSICTLAIYGRILGRTYSKMHRKTHIHTHTHEHTQEGGCTWLIFITYVSREILNVFKKYVLGKE